MKRIQNIMLQSRLLVTLLQGSWDLARPSTMLYRPSRVFSASSALSILAYASP